MHDSDVPVSTVPIPAVPDAVVPDAEYDAAWVTEAYDSFAEALYAYCRSVVGEPAAAADAVQDTFVVTAFRLAELPEESLLRAWLHAVARNECLRAIRDGAATPALEFPPSDSSADGTANATGDSVAAPDETSVDLTADRDVSSESSQVKALLRASLGGLDPAERDFMIMTWHGLDVAECAAVLGVTHDEASKILFRGRDQLEASAGVMTVARSGSRACAQLSGMLVGWDGRLVPALRVQLRQHIDHCEACGDQRRAGMRPAVLLRLAPDALRAMAAGTSPLTAWVTSRLREQVLAAAFGTELESFERRAVVVHRSGPYRDDGFPVPLDPPGAVGRRKHRSPVPLVLAGVGGTGLLAVAVVAGLILSGNYSTGALPSWTGLGLAQSATVPAGRGSSASASASPSGRHLTSANASASPVGSTAAPTTTPATRPSASVRPSATASARPTASRSSGAPASPTPTVKSAPVAPSNINVSPGSLLLSPDMGGGYGGSLTLINPTSSDMTWSMSLPQGLASWRNVLSGTLQPNSNTTQLFIFTTGHSGHGHGQGQSETETITLDPGGVQVTVTIPS